jgi:hypothetical protein
MTEHRLNKLTLLLTLIYAALFNHNAAAQAPEMVNLSYKKLNVYLKGSDDLAKYFKANFDLVNYTRDPGTADIMILILNHSNANGGDSYKVIFEGGKDFAGTNDTLRISFQKSDSEETKYLGLLKIFKIGLVRYMSHTGYINGLKIKYVTGPDVRRPKLKDNWDFWVFSLSSSGALKAEESKKDYAFEGEALANRETNQSKIKLAVTLNNELQSFDVDSITTKSVSRSLDLKGTYVKSLGEHFSAGFYSEYYSSSFDNIKSEIKISPAVEYDYFPYSESLSREFTLKYMIGISDYRYYEETIYGKTKQNLFSHSIKVKYEFKEIWGNAQFSLEGSQFLNDLNKNRLEFSSDLDIRIFEGFYVTASLDMNWIHDQLYLPAQGATEAEILLNQKQLASQYKVKLNLGLTYSFGSIYNNVINTRF